MLQQKDVHLVNSQRTDLSIILHVNIHTSYYASCLAYISQLPTFYWKQQYFLFVDIHGVVRYCVHTNLLFKFRIKRLKRFNIHYFICHIKTISYNFSNSFHNNKTCLLIVRFAFLTLLSTDSILQKYEWLCYHDFQYQRQRIDAITIIFSFVGIIITTVTTRKSHTFHSTGETVKYAKICFIKQLKIFSEVLMGIW